VKPRSEAQTRLPDLRFGILGSLEARRGNEAVSLGGPKQRSLLALLLLHANTPISADRLISQLWGEGARPREVNALQVQVSRLRRRLAGPADDASPSGLVTGMFGYLLRLEPERLDAREFERLLGDGRRALHDGDPRRAAERLREALHLWRGPALADVANESFAQDEIRRLEELRLDAQEARIDADLALARHGEVIAELDQLIAQHPHRERQHGQLMVALYRSGRQVDALAVYHRARQMLATELGLAPSPHLRHLERAILQHDSSVQSPSHGNPGPQAIGRQSDPGRYWRTPTSGSTSTAFGARYIASRRVADSHLQAR
jgi:DNA-binding SARP family transcriptional activator